MKDEPLGLPKGSIRGILSLIAVLGFVIGAATGNDGLRETCQPLAATVIGLYFGGRLANGGNKDG